MKGKKKVKKSVTKSVTNVDEEYTNGAQDPK